MRPTPEPQSNATSLSSPDDAAIMRLPKACFKWKTALNKCESEELMCETGIS